MGVFSEVCSMLVLKLFWVILKMCGRVELVMVMF